MFRVQRKFKLQLRELEESLLTAFNSEVGRKFAGNDKVMSQLEEIKNKSEIRKSTTHMML